MIRILTAGLLLGTIAAGTALAQSSGDDQDHHGRHGRHHGAEMMEKLDTNKDGAIDAAEFEAAAANHHGAFAAGADGSLTREQAVAQAVKQATERATERATRMFDRLDADKDGTISQAEFKESRGRMFDRMDRNDDGKLTLEDRPEGKHGRHGGHHEGRHEGDKPAQDDRKPEDANR